ncbi:hypothetical protein Ddye_005978 [Dipteronia dyeriana]|uniref:HAT C-terminal dimerisation domain-containing protein n=1 Tax=Dipteronia dyeriana TaxID=168575 RepID=A0AAD9XH57_9ROSI|nr:hypothetical protein Ddye_005978 [Dipteronia dyeriana]
MWEPEPEQLDNIGFDDTAYHEFLQRQAYLESLNYPANPNPPLMISELNASQPSPCPRPRPSPGNMTSQSKNIPDFAVDPNFKEALEKDKKQTKSNLFVLHMKKVTKLDGTCWTVCNYCPKKYKWTKSEGYSTYRKHIMTCHPAEIAKGSTQSQISRCACHVLNLYVQKGDGDSDQFDILHWWREHQKHFPILSIIAKQILATPVSIMAMEQEFSAGENIMDARRSLLSPESIQVQVCVDDWAKAEYRQQEMESEVIYDFFNDDHTTGTGTEDSD